MKYIFFLLIFLTVTSKASDLRSRGYAGFQYRDLTNSEIDTLGFEEQYGLYVKRVFPNTPAQQAGLQVGDIVLKYNQTKIVNGNHLSSIMTDYYADDKISITYRRNSKIYKSILILKAFPKEINDEIDIEYTSFTSHPILLRAVITSPKNSGSKKLPAVLMVSALNSPRLIGFTGYLMTREIAHELSKNGFRVLRFELRGFGDSQGEYFRKTDFDTEVRDNLAAFDYMINRQDVEKVFVWGHSTGGIVAAIIAQKRETAGLITSCTIGRTFYERMSETLELQGEFAGDSPDKIENRVKDYLQLTSLVSNDNSIENIKTQYPNLKPLINQNNRIMDDRTVEYWKQQLNLNLSEIYSSVSEPVLIIYGLSDYLTQLKCHEHIQRILEKSGNKHVELMTFQNLDHRYCYARTKKESYDHYSDTKAKRNFIAVDETVKWLKQNTGAME